MLDVIFILTVARNFVALVFVIMPLNNVNQHYIYLDEDYYYYVDNWQIIGNCALIETTFDYQKNVVVSQS